MNPTRQTRAEHGTPSRYSLGCRCQPCTEAHRLDGQQWRASHAGRTEETPHGTDTGYTNWGCRCQPCRAARRTEMARQRAAKKRRRNRR